MNTKSSDAAARSPEGGAGAAPWVRYWRRRRRVFAALFLTIVAALIFHYASSIEWRKVLESFRRIDRSTLLLAGACAAGSHLVYACTDLFARRVIAGRVTQGRSMAIAFVCYAFNLNLGSWVGSIGFRYRLYGRFGIDVPDVTRIIGLSLITNWSGYLLLAGIAFSWRWVVLPPSWELGMQGLQAIGIALLAALAAGVLLAALSRRREWTILGRTGALPPLRVVLGQITVSSCNWLLIAGVLFVLMREHADYPAVLTVLLLAAIAGSIAHIPGGLGVTEGVFLALLGSRIPHADLFAALLTYRALYYLIPLAFAVLVYASLEVQSRTRAIDSSSDAR